MFFNKKKEEKPAVKEEKKSKKQKEKAEPLSKEEMQRLEDTKFKLFGSLSRKKHPVEGDPSTPVLIGSKPKPDLPPRPVRLKESAPSHPPPLPPLGISNGDSMLSPLMSPQEGGEYGFHPLKTFNLPGVNLPALTTTTMTERSLVLPRLSSGDFGFSLRRAQIIQRYPDNSEQRVTVIFAEPLSSQVGMPSSHQVEMGLLPGDQLISVNGKSVIELTRDEVIHLIRQSGDTVTLAVRPVPELSELTIRSQMVAEPDDTESGMTDKADIHLRTTGVKRRRQARLEAAAAMSSTIQAGHEKAWLTHKGGYAAAYVLGPEEAEGKVKIKLDASDEEMVVDTDDIEKANPTELDRVEDLAHLLYLNESSVLHLLRQRFGSNLIHAYAGSQSTIIINPVLPLSFYHEKIIRMFKGCKREDMPPHIYAVAQTIYRNMQSSGRSQSMVFTGRSGSGKTTQFRHLFNYLCLVAGSTGKLVNIEKLNSIHSILEAFGNCRTQLNQNASRFATVMTFDFDHCSQISAGSVQALLLESYRVLKRPENESTFHIFYYFWEGCDDALKKELHLNLIDTPTGILVPLQSSADKEAARTSWNRLISAFTFLNISPAEQKVICCMLAAIIHLSFAEATRGVISSKSQFLRVSHAQHAANLLGVSLEDLHRTVFLSQTQVQDQKRMSGKASSASSLRKGDKPKVNFRASLGQAGMSVTDRVGDGMNALEAFIIGLYRETFNLLVSLINRSLTSNYRTLTSITVVDCPGFQNPSSLGRSNTTKRAGSFSDFCFNYANERLHQLFYQSSFTNHLDLYRQEQVEVDFEEPSIGPQALVEIMDKPSQQELIHSTNIELRSQEKRGLLWLLDEESIFPGATDESFMERVFVHYGDRRDGLLRKSRHYNHFVLRHCLGSNSVTYNVVGWLRMAQESPVTRAVLPLLQDSNKESLSGLFVNLRSGALPGFSAGIDSSTSLRRATTVLKGLNNPQALKRKSYCAMTKVQMDWIVETVRRVGKMYFVHCMLPHSEAGTGMIDRSNQDVDNALINVPLLRSQIRGVQLVESVRLNKIGFPERMPFGEFKRRFDCLAPDNSTGSAMLDDRRAANDLLQQLEIDTNQYRLGLSQVFLRSELLCQLEDKRDEILTGMITALQAHCRSFVARKQLEKRKVQNMAIRCIQKNISKYMKVKTWPWWKLYTRVLPLLDVHRTDEELKTRAEEIDLLRMKADKLEKLCTELRLHCDRLEAKLSSAQSDLAEERAAGSQTTEALEQENTERLRLEKEFAETKSRQAVAERKAHRLELEVMEYKNLKSALPDDEGSEDVGYKEKFNEVKRQLEGERKQHQQEKREEQEHHQSVKRQMDRKLSESQKEMDEVKEVAESQKRKAKTATDELQDVRMHLQQVTARNNELEKKQKKFDSELKSVKEDIEIERKQKDRFLREKEESMTKIYQVQQEVRETNDELEEYQTKCKKLQHDLEELNQATVNGVSESEVMSLRRTKQELEAKWTEQEEELDELAGKSQMLESTVTRLEMQIERSKHDHQREVDLKEQQLEDLRAQTQRRVKSLEQQLEDEYEEKASLQRFKRDLEIRLQQSSESQIHKDEATEVQLKRDLRKTKALLKDAQAVLQHYKDNAPSRGMLKQLKNQLEDAEFSRLSAVKAKQSLEGELTELRNQLDSSLVGKSLAEERCMQLMKEKNVYVGDNEDQDEELQQLLKKYKAQVQQGSVDTITLQDQTQTIADLEKEKQRLLEEVNELSSQVQWQESHTVDKHKLLLLEQKLKETDSKLELEISARSRVEALLSKSKQSVEDVNSELTSLKASKDREQELNRRLKMEYQQMQEILTEAQKKHAEANQKSHDLESALERVEQEHQSTLADLKLAMRRVEGLQTALNDDLEFDSVSEDDDDEEDEREQSSILGVMDIRTGSNFTSPLPNSSSSGGVARTGSGSSDASFHQKTSTPALL